jgi:hypothetical protein
MVESNTAYLPVVHNARRGRSLLLHVQGLNIRK